MPRYDDDERDRDDRDRYDDDDRPRRRRRRYDDDEPAPKQGSSKMLLVLLLLGGGFVVLVGCCGGILYYGKKNQPVDDGSQGIAITARQLDQEYEDNDTAADKKYKDKMLEVTGVIEYIDSNEKPGKIVVALTGTEDSTVDCRFSKSEKKDEIAELNVGQTVTIRGKCIGQTRDYYVTLEACSVVKPQDKKPDPKADPKTPLVVTADKLAEDYDDDSIAADKKYKGKLLEVSGVVMGVAKPRNGKVSVDLNVGAPGIQCDFLLKDAKPTLDTVKPNDKIVIRGTCQGDSNGKVLLEECTVAPKK